MRDVAVGSGVAIGTLYHYFQSKEHLFAEVLAEWATSLRGHVERTPLKGDTNEQRLQEVFRRSVRAFQAWPQLVRVLMTLEASTDPFASQIFAGMNGSIQDVWAEALTGVDTDVARITVKTAGAMLDLLLRQWVMGRLPVNEVYDQMDRAITVLVG